MAESNILKRKAENSEKGPPLKQFKNIQTGAPPKAVSLPFGASMRIPCAEWNETAEWRCTGIANKYAVENIHIQTGIANIRVQTGIASIQSQTGIANKCTVVNFPGLKRLDDLTRGMLTSHRKFISESTCVYDSLVAHFASAREKNCPIMMSIIEGKYVNYPNLSATENWMRSNPSKDVGIMSFVDDRRSEGLRVFVSINEKSLAKLLPGQIIKVDLIVACLLEKPPKN